MLATTNRLTDEREVLELQPFEVQVEIAQENHELVVSRDERLVQLADIRANVECRGYWQEYEALAGEYEKIGAFANAETLRRKANQMRGA